jgi:endonuclease/exonuclease/phosphatase family metal-dependent hydrolase
MSNADDHMPPEFLLWIFCGGKKSEPLHASEGVDCYNFLLRIAPLVMGVQSFQNESIEALFCAKKKSNGGSSMPKEAFKDTFQLRVADLHYDMLAFTSWKRVILLRNSVARSYSSVEVQFNAADGLLSARGGVLGLLVEMQQHPEALEYLQALASSADISIPAQDCKTSAPVEMTILSWNVALFKFMHVTTHKAHNMLPNVPRAHALAQFIHANYADTSVLALQEVFDTRTVGILLKELGVTFPYHVKPHKKAWRSMNSGLMLFSKLPILDYDIHTFKNFSGDEMWASKGFVSACVQPPNAAPVVLYNTHLQAGLGTTGALARVFGKKYHVNQTGIVRDKQMKAICDHMCTWKPRGVVTFVGGPQDGEQEDEEEAKDNQCLFPYRTFLVGDLNSNLHTVASAQGISSGKSWKEYQLLHSERLTEQRGNPHAEPNSVKYPAKHVLLSKLLHYKLPVNFTCIRSSAVKGLLPHIDWASIDEKGLYTSSVARPWVGSDPQTRLQPDSPISEARKPSEVCAVEGRLIDIIACDAGILDREGQESLQVTLHDAHGLSDHHILVGKYTRTA